MTYEKFLESKSKKQLALLIDPDKCNHSDVPKRIELAKESGVDYIFVGGSLMNYFLIDDCIDMIKAHTDIPVVLFPANGMHISRKADAILFLSLISGRNPDLLIGNHVHSAPVIKSIGLEPIPAGYMLVESGSITTAQYISNSIPIPRSKADVAISTAIAGEMLGLKAIYIDAGSGAQNPIPDYIIKGVKQNISIPLIVGGGLRTPEAVRIAVENGADIVVVGNAAEKDFGIIKEMTKVLNN